MSPLWPYDIVFTFVYFFPCYDIGRECKNAYGLGNSSLTCPCLCVHNLNSTQQMCFPSLNCLRIMKTCCVHTYVKHSQDLSLTTSKCGLNDPIIIWCTMHPRGVCTWFFMQNLNMIRSPKPHVDDRCKQALKLIESFLPEYYSIYEWTDYNATQLFQLNYS